MQYLLDTHTILWHIVTRDRMIPQYPVQTVW